MNAKNILAVGAVALVGISIGFVFGFCAGYESRYPYEKKEEEE